MIWRGSGITLRWQQPAKLYGSCCADNDVAQHCVMEAGVHRGRAGNKQDIRIKRRESETSFAPRLISRLPSSGSSQLMGWRIYVVNFTTAASFGLGMNFQPD